MAITHERLGFQEFKEASIRGFTQEHFTTIEVGFVPWVPFSKKYAMESRWITGTNAFDIHPTEGSKKKPWMKRVQRFEEERGETIGDMTKKAKGIGSQAALLSMELSKLLEREGIVGKFETTVKEEIETQAIARIMLDTFEEKDWKNPAVDTQIELVTKLMGPTTWNTTFDMIARDQKSADAIDYNLHILANRIGADGPAFVQGVKTIETTNMTAKKFFQTKLHAIPKWQDDIHTNWNKAVEKSMNEIIKEWDIIGKDLWPIYEEAKAAVAQETAEGKAAAKLGGYKFRKGPETLAYATRQMLSRFLEIQYTQGLGEAYIYSAPVAKYALGVARLEPVFKDGILMAVRSKDGGPHTEVIEFENAQRLRELYGEEIFRVIGSRRLYSTHRAMLFDDAISRYKISDEAALAFTMEESQATVDQLALTSGRIDMIGSALEIESSIVGTGVVGGSAVVTAAEVLSSKEAAETFKQQFREFFKDPKFQSDMSEFYKKAANASNSLTDLWKDNLNLKNKHRLPHGSGIFGPPFWNPSESGLEGIGIPFWYSQGRDASAFLLFKTKETLSAADFKAKGLIDPRSKYITQFHGPKGKGYRKRGIWGSEATSLTRG